MGKRACERFPVNDIEVKFFCQDTVYYGNVVNLSAKGMYIVIKDEFIPANLKLDLFIFTSDEIFHIPAKIIRLLKTDDLDNGIGVELLSLPQSYLEFLIRLNFVHES